MGAVNENLALFLYIAVSSSTVYLYYSTFESDNVVTYNFFQDNTTFSFAKVLFSAENMHSSATSVKLISSGLNFH